jgi:hypothetical protein
MPAPQYANNALGPGDIFIVSSSNAAAANNLSLPSLTGRTTFLDGFAITGLGATAASTIQITTSNINSGSSFYLTIPAGATTALTPLIVNFTPFGLGALGSGLSIVVGVPSFGAGNTNAAASAWGHFV